MNRKQINSMTAMLAAVVVGLALLLAMVLISTPVEASQPRFQFPTPPPATDTPEPSPVPPTDTPPAPKPPTETPSQPGPPTPSGGGKPDRGKETGGPEAVPLGAPSAKFKLNSCARVARAGGMDLFDAPGFGSGYLQLVGVNQQVRVLGGPVGADNLWWWQFRTSDGKTGWSVSDYAEPSAGPCAGGGAVLDLTKLPLTGVGGGSLVAGGVLVVVLIVAGVLRRKTSIK